MAVDIKNIKTLGDLDKAIARQKSKARAMEKKIDDNFDHLQRNYASMVKNSIFKINIGGESLAGTILQNILGNERIQHSLRAVMGKLGDRFADWIEKFTDKMGRKEEK